MKITFLTPYYPPEMGAPPARIHEIALRLKEFGHEVTVVTAFPNRPLGRIYDGYNGKFLDSCMEEGVRIIRTWIRPSASSASFLWRMINDLSFTWSSGWTTKKLLGFQDILIVQNPPVFSVFSSVHLARKTGAKIVMWCGDVWPDVLLQSGQIQPGVVASTIRLVQQYAFRKSSLVAVTNPRIANDTAINYRCPKISVWSNGVDTTIFNPDHRSEELRKNLGLISGQILVGYVGLHGRFQGLDTILEAAKKLKHDNKFRFVFVGEGVEKSRLRGFVNENNLINVLFLDPKPKSDMPTFVASCDIAVVSLLKRMPGTMPSKFYEALASGVIPLTAKGCEAEALVFNHQAGVLYEPGDSGSVMKALISVAEQPPSGREAMRKRCRNLALRFDRNRIAAHVNNCLTSLVQGLPLPEYEW